MESRRCLHPYTGGDVKDTLSDWDYPLPAYITGTEIELLKILNKMAWKNTLYLFCLFVYNNHTTSLAGSVVSSCLVREQL